MKIPRLLLGAVLLGALSVPGRLRAAEAAAPSGLTATASGLKYAVTVHGGGARPHAGQVVIARYTGTLPDGTVFDATAAGQEPFAFTLGKKQVIKGWDEGFALLQVGDHATLVIPPELAYGATQRGPIPPNSTLRFDVELVGLKDTALADLLQATIDKDGLAAAQQQFKELSDVKFGDAFVSEAQLNGLGYHYLGKDKLPEALAVLQWAVELFPQSGNACDSLGEAEVTAGLRGPAIAHYTKSLALDPKNKNAEKVLAEIKDTPDEPGALREMQERMTLDAAFDAADEAADKQVYDVPALRAKLTAFLAKYPADRDAGGFVANFFYYAESVDLKTAEAEWRAFAASPIAKVREQAEQKLKLAELIKSPIDLKYTAADGSAVDVAALRGKVVLVDFWATWCGPCVQEIPNVVAAYNQYHPQGFEIVGVSFDKAPDPAKPSPKRKTAEGMLAFTREKGMTWPQFYDGTGWDNPIGKRYDIRAIPAMFLLDKRGLVVSTNARGPRLAQEIKRLLQE
jgi:thiol-disulfide isomerase/thioredoxin